MPVTHYNEAKECEQKLKQMLLMQLKQRRKESKFKKIEF